MKYFPVFLDLNKKAVLITGYGPEAEVKIRQMLSSGAEVKYVSGKAPLKLRNFLRDEGICFLNREYRKSDLDDVWLIISVSEDEEFNKKVHSDAESRNIFSNIVDVTGLCNFIFPALITQGDIGIAVSTSGTSPALAQRLKKEISAVVVKEYGILAEIMGRKRSNVIHDVKNKKRRAALFRRLVNSDMLALLKNNLISEAESLADKIIEKEIRRTYGQNRRKQRIKWTE